MLRTTWKRAAALGFGGVVGFAGLMSDSAQAQAQQQYGRSSYPYPVPVRRIDIPQERRLPPIPAPVPSRVPWDAEQPPIVIEPPVVHPRAQAPAFAPEHDLGRLVEQCGEQFHDLADEIDDELCSPFKGRLTAHAHALEDQCDDLRRALRRNVNPLELERGFQRLDQGWSVLKTGLLRHGELPRAIARDIQRTDRLNAEIQQVLAASETVAVDPALVASACQVADQAQRVEQLIVSENRCGILIRDVHRLSQAAQALRIETDGGACPKRLGAALVTVQREARQVAAGLERTRSGFEVFRAWQAFEANADAFGQQLAALSPPAAVIVPPSAPIPPPPVSGEVTSVNLGFRFRIR